MSEVKRFEVCCRDEIRPVEVVQASDYDAAQSELSALREELDALKNHCADLEGVNEIIKKARDAAEQRNASHESMIRHFANCADVRRVGTAAMDYAAALKPTESGAGE